MVLCRSAGAIEGGEERAVIIIECSKGIAMLHFSDCVHVYGAQVGQCRVSMIFKCVWCYRI